MQTSKAKWFSDAFMFLMHWFHYRNSKNSKKTWRTLFFFSTYWRLDRRIIWSFQHSSRSIRSYELGMKYKLWLYVTLSFLFIWILELISLFSLLFIEIVPFLILKKYLMHCQYINVIHQRWMRWCHLTKKWSTYEFINLYSETCLKLI